MVGMDPTNENGAVIPIRAAEARRAAGMTSYEQDWIDLQSKMDDRGMPNFVRLSVRIRDPLALGKISEILHRLANEITSVQAEAGLNDFTLLSEVYHKARDAERRLRDL